MKYIGNKLENILELDKAKNGGVSYQEVIEKWFIDRKIAYNEKNLNIYFPIHLLVIRLESEDIEEEIVINEELKVLIGMSEIDRLMEIETIRANNLEDESYITAVSMYLDKYLLDIKKTNINKYVPQTIVDRLEIESIMNGSLKGRNNYKLGK